MRCTELSIEIERDWGLKRTISAYQKISAILRKLHIYAMLIKREDFKTGKSLSSEQDLMVHSLKSKKSLCSPLYKKIKKLFPKPLDKRGVLGGI